MYILYPNRGDDIIDNMKRNKMNDEYLLFHILLGGIDGGDEHNTNVCTL